MALISELLCRSVELVDKGSIQRHGEECMRQLFIFHIKGCKRLLFLTIQEEEEEEGTIKERQEKVDDQKAKRIGQKLLTTNPKLCSTHNLAPLMF